MIKIAASMICANWCKLGEEVRALEAAGVDMYHFDIMDGRFVPNITMGHQVLKALRPVTKLPFAAHLMIVEPERYIDRFVDAGADIVTIHAESTVHLHRQVKLVKQLGADVCVALNPTTPIEVVEYLLADLDMVLIMTVDPGYAGQKFIEAMVDKVRKLKELLGRYNLEVDIEVDGGIGPAVVPKLVKAGANVFVGGSSGLFLAGVSYEEAVRALRASAQC